MVNNYDLADVLRQPDTKQARHLLRHGEGESFAVPLKIRATGFAGHFIRKTKPGQQPFDPV